MPYIPVTSPEQIESMQDGFFAGDELWTWADARVSGSKKNKFITPILAKSRKRGIHIGYTVQAFRQIDVRIRNITDFICMAKLNESESLCRLFVYTQPSMQLQRVFKFRTAPVFDLYDTKEEVSSLNIE